MAIAALAIVWVVVVRAALNAQSEVQFQGDTGEEPPPRRERQSDPQAPEISFIDSPTATCYRPIDRLDTCYIEWNYLAVTASSSQYIISMTVSIDGKLRAYYAGFFQTSMYVPADFHKPGFMVTCGKKGASGYPNLGKSYSYILRARETGGLAAANYGSVTCPYGFPGVYLPWVARH